ncbi:MAG: C2H2-type zinc finger protein [Pseudomonadota bacterium]
MANFDRVPGLRFQAEKPLTRSEVHYLNAYLAAEDTLDAVKELLAGQKRTNELLQQLLAAGTAEAHDIPDDERASDSALAFECPTCHKRFVTKLALTGHMRTHDKATE